MSLRNGRAEHNFVICSITGIPAPYKFTGKIDKVTIDLKETKKAEKAEENKRRAEATHKKAMSD